MDKTATHDIAKRLDALIFILLTKEVGKSISLKDQIKILDSLSFRPVEIASILGKTNTHISKELAGIRKAGKKKVNG